MCTKYTKFYSPLSSGLAWEESPQQLTAFFDFGYQPHNSVAASLRRKHFIVRFFMASFQPG